MLTPKLCQRGHRIASRFLDLRRRTKTPHRYGTLSRQSMILGLLANAHTIFESGDMERARAYYDKLRELMRSSAVTLSMRELKYLDRLQSSLIKTSRQMKQRQNISQPSLNFVKPSTMTLKQKHFGLCINGSMGLRNQILKKKNRKSAKRSMLSLRLY